MAECTSSSSSWSNVSGANQRYRDLDTAAMHFWIDKRGVGAAGAAMGGGHGHGPCGPLPLSHHGHYGRYGHRVSASIASSRLPPGAAPQRRRRPSRSYRVAGHSGANAAKATAPAVHRDRGSGTTGTGAGPGGGAGDASTSGSTTSTTTALTAATLAASSSTAASAGASRRVTGMAAPVLAPAPLLARAARAHLALPRPRLAYIGSTGSGIRAHGAGGMLVDMEGMGGHGPSLGTSSGNSDRADVFGLGALPLPVHGESPPVLMDRFTCGLWASFALASVFVAGTKFYLDFQSSGMEAMVLSLLLMIFLMVGCTASICRARVNSQLAAAAAAATASALRGDTGPGGVGLRRSHLGDSGELVEVVIDRHGHGPSMGMENVPGLASGQQTQQHQLLQQVQQEQLAEQQMSTEPPPPYHIAMLDEQPPPAYEKVVT